METLTLLSQDLPNKQKKKKSFQVTPWAKLTPSSFFFVKDYGITVDIHLVHLTGIYNPQ